MGHIKKVVEYIRQEDFIPLVKELPAVWNIHCEDYSNRTKKKQAWETVYVQFFEDYHERSPEEQTEIAICFQTKWKSLRNSYSRELKRQKDGSNADGRRKYVYFDQLRFLENAQKTPYYAEGSASSDADGTGSSASTPNKAKRCKVQNSDRSADTFNDDLDDGEESGDSTTNHDDSNNDRDGDKMFMLSLVPEFKRIPENKRLLAKSEILNVILKAQGFV